MEIWEMKNKIANAYSSPAWKYRVYNKMANNQIIAIYNNMLERGQFKKKTLNKGRKNEPHQIDIFEYYGKDQIT